MDKLDPDFVDIHVGQALRRRRVELGQSQIELAQAIGVSFQQVQKYERAANRISASMIYKAAKAQGVAPSYYFPDLPHDVSAEADVRAKELKRWLASREAWNLAEAMMGAPQAARLTLVRLLREMSTDGARFGSGSANDLATSETPSTDARGRDEPH